MNKRLNIVNYESIQIFAIIIILTLILGLNMFYQYGSAMTVEFIVESKERIVTNGENKKSKYLIFTKNEVFQNTDTALYLKFDSSDLYRTLKKGKAYKAKVYGWRLPFLSTHRNIVSAKEIKGV